MKSNLTLTFLLFALITFNSCSSVVSKDDCKKDMLELGLEHGKKGLNKLTDEVRSACISAEQTLDLELYEKGFNMGWSSYCIPFNGFDMGRKGDIYKSYCPPEKEELFREKFLIGKKVNEKKDQVSEIQEKIKELSVGSDISALEKEELKKLKDYLQTLNRDIQILEQQGMSLIHTNPL